MAGALELDAQAFGALRDRLDEALALPPSARAAWLQALRAEDAALKPHLLRLLAHAGDDTGLARFDTLPPLAPGADDTLDEPGADAGPYRCLRLLGTGGQSTVWLAERRDVLLGRPVALKRPRVAWSGSGLAQRVAQEREILGRLDHPNIARIYDAGVDAGEQPWLALEYVEGMPVDRFVRERGLGLPAIVALVAQVADAVAHAHARLVVHRDLKPGNILVEASGQVKLVDFGIAKLLDESALADGGLTRDAPQPRTPWYAAPEQLLGQPVSAGTDVYALGVVLYELLTGQRPYRPARDSAAALEEAILRDEPPRPSSLVRDRALARGLRNDLDTIVLKAMRKSASERYRSMQEFADDLERWTQSRPIRARPASLGYRSRKFVARNRVILAASTVFVSLLCVALGGALWQADRARAEAAKARAIQDYLVGLFETAGVDRRDALRLRAQTVQQLLEGSARSLPQSLPGQPQVRDELEHVVVRLLTDLEIAPAAVRLEQERLRQLEEARAPLGQRVAAWLELARGQHQAGDLAASRATLQRAEAACVGAGGEAATSCQVVRVETGRLDYEEQHIDAALARVEPAALRLEAIAPASLERADALELLGLLRWARNRADEALALYEQALSLREEAWGPHSVRLAIARFGLGRDLWSMRRLDRAEALMRQAWSTVAEGLGPTHPASARVELNLGRLTYYVGLRTDGLAHLRHAAESIVSHADELDPHELLDARVFLGNVLLLDGQLAAAGHELAQALALRARLDKAAWRDPTLDQSYGRWLLDQGRFAEARAWMEDFRRRLLAIHGAQHPDVAEASLRLAWVAMAEGDLDRAREEIDRVLASQDAGEALFGSVKHRAMLAGAFLALERGDVAAAQAQVAATAALVERTPRQGVYRDVLFQVHELAARTAAAAGDPARARSEFQQAVEVLASVDARHPYLAALRCRYAQSLARVGEAALAAQQLERARPAFEAVPAPGPQFLEVWRQVRRDVRIEQAESVVHHRA